jgi:hypothetical protein
MPKATIIRHLLILVCFVVLISSNVPAREQTLGSLKAAYVYNIAKFTRWPDSAFTTEDNQFKLCLYGDDDTISQLKLLTNRNLNNRTILVKAITTESAINDCQLLYISATENRRYRYLLSLINKKTTLTISNDSRFLRLGGLINLTELGQRLQFEVNMEQLENSKLTLSSKLLALGKLTEQPR